MPPIDIESIHPLDCPEWKDTWYTNHREILTARAATVLRALRNGEIDTRALAVDTRPLHGELFHELVPPKCDYYAGHYRGEKFRCLRNYGVWMPGDSRVGEQPSRVLARMTQLAEPIQTAIVAFDTEHEIARVDQRHRLLYVVATACCIFVTFLQIHPFANGNGHAARFFLKSFLGRYGYWLKRWPLEPRPPDPPYTELIKNHRNGNPEPLETHILKCMMNT